MAITRTPIIDDDGSGSTGTVIDNSWKQQLYDQIDAVTGGTYGSWIPTDASGGGLTLTYAGTGGTYAKSGRVVTFWVELTYPATSNPAASAIGGLPFPIRGNSGAAAQGYGKFTIWLLYLGGTFINGMNPTSGLNASNQELSGAHLIISGSYLTD